MWLYRTDTRRGDMAHGITFLMFENPFGGQAEFAHEARKVTVDGTTALALALNQTKYPDQLIAQVFTKETPQELARRANGWTRVQVFLGNVDEDTVRMLEDLTTKMRERLLWKAWQPERGQ